MFYLCSENKGADQLRGYREADLRLCFRICKNPVFSRCGSNNPQKRTLIRRDEGTLLQRQIGLITRVSDVESIYRNLSLLKIFQKGIVSLLLIQENKLSVSGGRMYTKYW